jgi:hypothetical protein
MKLRLLKNKGGNGAEHDITVLSDSGSNIISILSTDLKRLGKSPAFLKDYRSWNSVSAVYNSDDVTRYCPGLLVQIQLVNRKLSQKSNWIYEQAILKPIRPGLPRLSGNRIRDAMYLATAPRNKVLAISSTKLELMSILAW